MKKLIAMSILTSLSTVGLAETAEFTDVDTNEDGVLSTYEAKQALPEVLIVDNNNDGMLNQSEAEVAVPGLMFAANGKDKSTQLIGPAEYEHIVEAISKRTGQSEKS